MKAIYIAWINYQRRAESMQNYFGYEIFYVATGHVSRRYKIGAYLLQCKRTLDILLRERPDVVWLQLPPNFLVHLLLLFRWISRRPIVVITDCHNAAFRRPWRLFPFTSFALNRGDLVLVHNRDVIGMAQRAGVLTERLRVLEDCVPSLATVEPAGNNAAMIVMPCSFHADEPIKAVLDAARQVPAATFVITGNRKKVESQGLIERAPANVVFPGFLPAEEFDRLLLGASAVLCLTTEEGIQLSAASEAIAAGRPMILSDTRLLRELFGEGAIFVDNSASSIAAACRNAIEHGQKHSEAVRALGQRRMSRWLSAAAPIRARIAGGGEPLRA
ncbi:MAG: hypothetical protein C0522_07090 [Rhodocyclaceae bacterium]|nr:hypothetical protein [Rhodocyclaceae bacterium]